MVSHRSSTPRGAAKNPGRKKPLVAGLDIGTTKTVVTIGTVGPNGLEVVGVGQSINHGLRQGVVINIEATTESIRKAKEEAELMAGEELPPVWMSVGGTHIDSFDSSGMVAIRNDEVRKEDVDRVIEAAKAVVIPTDRQVLHILPKDYRIDGQEGIRDPIGMSGVRLEASVHIITGSQSAIQNVIKCVQKVNLGIQGIVLEQLASSKAVLSEDEKNLGVAVVDLGGGTCDTITFLQGSVIHTGVVPVGGYNFTHDVAMGLRTTQANAEHLKRKYGCSIPEMVDEAELIEVEGVGGRQKRNLSRAHLCQVLEARAEETLNLISAQFKSHNLLEKLGSGIVLTGGVSNLPGIIEMAEFIFDVPVRKGQPLAVGGLTDVVSCPSFSTSVGLMLYGMEQEKLKNPSLLDEDVFLGVNSWTHKMKNWLGL